MLRHHRFHFVLCFLFVCLLRRAAGQAARGNGRGSDQLNSVEPGGPVFTRRNTTACPSTRTIDGTCTNSLWRAAGSAGTAHFSYFHDISSTEPTGADLPSPRLISNIVCPQTADLFNSRSLSEFIVFFAQFLDHTIVATTVNREEEMNIEIPHDDPIFANFTNGELPFERNNRGLDISEPGRASSGNIERPINILSSSIDLASVYSSSPERLAILRDGKDGLMKTSGNNMLPRNTAGFFNSPTSSDNFFIAGDHRSNEHPILTSFHTLFMREHNRLAGELKETFPSWNNDELFETARMINIAQFQKIVYEEFFPMMTGRSLRAYKGYRSNAIPAVSVTFSTAAYRIGHTMVGPVITRRGPGMSSLSPVTMEEMFFRTSPQFLENGIEPFIRGAIFQRAQEIDTLVVDALRNFLFIRIPEESGFDLIALNLQRSRDHALPKYNELRKRFTGRSATSFADVTSDQNVQSRLQTAYGDVDNMEAWIGLVAEDHIPGGSMGPTMFAIWSDEFSRLRDGDRFFYLSDGLFSDELLNNFPRLREILSERDTMAQVILRNSDVTEDEIGMSVWIGRN